MGIRRRGRECALQILYQVEVSTGAQALNGFYTLSPANLSLAVEAFFAHFDAPPDVLDYASSLVRGVQLNGPRIDEIIIRHSLKWRLERMPIVDRNVLRIATYELMFSSDLPTGVILDEAIEIARRFGGEKSPQFVNGLLDRIAADVRRPLSGSKT